MKKNVPGRGLNLRYPFYAMIGSKKLNLHGQDVTYKKAMSKNVAQALYDSRVKVFIPTFFVKFY